jgi:MFS family permease
MTAMVEKLDSRVLNIAFSFVLTGLSVGIIIPCMPLLVSQLQISPSAFGFVISAFGLSRLLGNIPSGYLVEKYGRKPVISAGLMLCGLGNFAISLIFLPGLGASWLVLCRFLAGFGVSAFVAGGYMYISDISTHLNRTRTIAPVMASFSAGTALGPAIGGVLVDQIGLANTYAAVGACFGIIGMMSQMTMNETMKRVPDSMELLDKQLAMKAKHSSETPTNLANSNSSKDLMSSFKVAYTSWKDLLKIPRFKNLVMLNGSLWFADFAGNKRVVVPSVVSPEGPRHRSHESREEHPAGRRIRQ